MKPNIYGSHRSFLPNNRADSRRPKLWEHNRQIAERDEQEVRQKETQRRRLEQEVARFYAHRSD